MYIYFIHLHVIRERKRESEDEGDGKRTFFTFKLIDTIGKGLDT